MEKRRGIRTKENRAHARSKKILVSSFDESVEKNTPPQMTMGGKRNYVKERENGRRFKGSE